MEASEMMKGCLSVGVLLSVLLSADCETKKTGTEGQTGQKEVKKIAFDPKIPCNLLTKEEVEAVMKQRVREPQPQDYACTYESVDSSKFTSLIFSLEDVDAPGLFRGMKEYFEKSGKKLIIVEGVGDGAYFFEKELHVLKGKYFFHFLSSGNEGYELREDAIKSLAKTAVDKLP